MTGREFIMYILENHLEDEPIFKNGTLIGYITAEQAAEKKGVGVSTIYTLIMLGQMECVMLDNTLLVPVKCVE